MLAKSYFDCREFERCASVFLPSGLPKGAVSSSLFNAKPTSPLMSTKNVPKDSFLKNKYSTRDSIPLHDQPPQLSQKALFLALYARYMAGEKRKEEATEMVLGPADKASVTNGELVGIAKVLENYFAARHPEQSSGGWLEYLYGIVLSKGKNEEDSKRWLIRSVLLFPYNWGAWLELCDLLNSIEEVSRHPRLKVASFTLLTQPV